ncbi:hypothetical protein HYR69_09905 [Candidatus Sumerlaeota bacterium]|nr:hypothetical protein [Candidatus Sumerlaeota bacterium]
MLYGRTRNRTLGISAHLALGMLALIVAGTGAVRAQTTALVDITGDPKDKDPHPTTYIWEGPTDPVKDPVQYYTFYYTGTIGYDARVPVGTKIQRIAISNADWEANKAAVIARLTSYYEQAYNTPAAQTEKKVVFDENFNYVEVGGDQKKAGAVDPRAAAEWMFYYDQFVLWQYYCRRVLINETDAVNASSTRDFLQRESDRKALEGIQDLNVDEALKAVEEARKADAPDEPAKKGGAKPKATKPSSKGSSSRPPSGGGGGKGGIKHGGGGAGAASKTKPTEDVEVEVATKFDPDQDYADPEHNLVFRDEFLELAKKREKNSTDIFTKMLARIDGRAQEMQRYEEWLGDRRKQLHEFTQAWGKVKTGDNVYFDDIFYILVNSDMEIESPDYTTLVIPVRDATTPQDLIERDGRLKKPKAD